MSNPNEAKTLSSKRRLAQILGILKKHHITKGVDLLNFGKFWKIWVLPSSKSDKSWQAGRTCSVNAIARS